MSKENSQNTQNISYKKRSLARLVAIQVFHQYHFFKRVSDLEEIKNELVENYVLSADEDPSSYRDKVDLDLTSKLLSGLVLSEKEISTEIGEFLKGDWTPEKLDEIVLLILQFATLELKFLKDVPPRVVINEYVNIAASFFNPKMVTFVNGILENMAKKLRSEEMVKIHNSKQND